MYRCDCHVHTRYSFDGSPEATVEAVCRAAKEKGLAEITITDHCDINGEVEGIYSPYALDEARRAVMAAREAYSDTLVVNWGIELGQPHQYPREAAELIARGGFDFVLGSLHNLRDVPDFFFLHYREMPDALIERLFVRMLSETLELVRFPGIHALAHLTYICRYLALEGREFDPLRYTPQLEEIFGEMIARGIALEINYSTLRGGLGFTMPDEALLRLYRSCGGKLITLGSDAHNPAAVAGGLDEALRLAADCGFTQAATYRKGALCLHSLI